MPKMVTWEDKALLSKYKAMGQKNENMRESGTWKINQEVKQLLTKNSSW